MTYAAHEDWAVTTAELNRLGFDKDTRRRWVRQGLLERRYRGVYVVAGARGPLTELRAASKAVPRGALDGTAAVWLDGFGPPPRAPFAVVVPPSTHGAHTGLRIHRVALTPADLTRRRGLPTTTAAVAVLHLAASLPQFDYEMLVQEAFACRRTDAKRLTAAIERHGGRTGVPLLRRMLELGVDDLRSRAERALRATVRRAGFPWPEFNVKVGRWRVDALWRAQRLALEINGFWSHASPWAHDRDHRKEQDLRTAGFEPIRFTAMQAIDEEPRLVAGIARGLVTGR